MRCRQADKVLEVVEVWKVIQEVVLKIKLFEVCEGGDVWYLGELVVAQPEDHQVRALTDLDWDRPELVFGEVEDAK